jgi:thymidylate kinase
MNLDWGWIWDMHVRCIRPDLTLFVDVPVEVCLQRIAAGRGGHFELFENQVALTHARQSYLRAIDRLCQAGEAIKVLDGNAPPESVHQAIWREVAGLVPDTAESGPYQPSL